MENRRNYYRILQVQPDAPLEIIRASYRTLMKKLKHHPDLGGDEWNAAVINEAYETLTDHHKRREYDKKLLAQYTKKTFPDNSLSHEHPTNTSCPFCKNMLSREGKQEENCPSCMSPLKPVHAEGDETPNHHRSIERIKKSGTLTYYSSWPQEGKEARVLDLSPKGVRFQCAEGLQENSVIKLNSPLLSAIARVVNTKKEAEGEQVFYYVGAQFLTVAFRNPKGSFFSTAV
jgi:curved DNA-binding protein CbpA